MKKIDLITMGIDRISGSPVVFLKIEKTKMALPIVIGTCEASVLAMAIQGEKFERPLSYDIIKILIEEHNSTISQVIIDDFKNNIYFSKLVLKKENNESVYIDCRPSDALILSVKNQLPIFVKEEIAFENSIEAQFLTEKGEKEESFDDFNIDELKKKFFEENKNNNDEENKDEK
jgi:hypothetical protein